MSRDIINKISKASILSPNEVRKLIPLSSTAKEFIDKSRIHINQLLHTNQQEFLLILGPCSIHNIQEAKEYALKIKSLQKLVSKYYLIVMRIYFAKPRTSLGWKGMLYDPDLNESNDIQKGILMTRQLLVDLAELGIPTATEFLDPISTPYFEDLVSWACIGARTSESQTHREMASSFTLPIGFKNNTHGCLKVAINGALSASKPQSFLGINQYGNLSIIKTMGNPNSHIVLRGGNSGPNYDPASITEAVEMLNKESLSKKILIDCSHGNSGSDPIKQITVFESVLNQFLDGNRNILGMILESYHLRGRQKISDRIHYGLSITDACLDWETTEKLILWGYERLQKNFSNIEKEYDSKILVQ